MSVAVHHFHLVANVLRWLRYQCCPLSGYRCQGGCSRDAAAGLTPLCQVSVQNPPSSTTMSFVTAAM